jgi:hypothetical protein
MEELGQVGRVLQRLHRLGIRYAAQRPVYQGHIVWGKVRTEDAVNGEINNLFRGRLAGPASRNPPSRRGCEPCTKTVSHAQIEACRSSS